MTRHTTQTIEYRLRRKDGAVVWLETTCQALVDKQTSENGTVAAFTRSITEQKHIEEAIEMLSRGAAAVTSEDFFRPFVSHVAYAMRASFAFVTETNPEHSRVRMLAFWKGNDFGAPFEYELADTPCDSVINQGKTCYYPVGVQAMFPKDQDLVSLKAQSYVGIPIYNAAGTVIGHLAVLDSKPMQIKEREMSILRIFAMRAGAELARIQSA
jgi:hypothetical protein